LSSLFIIFHVFFKCRVFLLLLFHGVAKRDQRIHASQDQAIDDLLKKDIDGASPKGCRIVGKKKPSARGGLGIHTN